jgi:UDP-N-acetylglucosamine--N-acetylmuramyl-(pentapeptide) pyrophosphoryl-undecaprenol N-acetylglucosamine transferase
MMANPVMILAGGTGGHVFPALAVAEVLAERGVPVVWLGTRRGLEARVVPAAGVPIEYLPVRALRGRHWVDTLTAPFMLMRALWHAVRCLARHRPRAVLGMGGYVAGPGAVAAFLRRAPLIIHEQNTVPGMTNRWLARLATRVLTGFDVSFPGAPGARFVGNPVRRAIGAIPAPEQRFAERDGPLRLLVIGGSLGARALNERLPRALARLQTSAPPVIRHQAGDRTIETARDAYRQAGVEAEVSEFIDDMAAAYAWADLVVCRAGALTVAELAAAGVPALFIPFPYAVDDHQTRNAAYLVNAGAAELIQERDSDAASLAGVLDRLLSDRQRLAAMAQRAREKGRPDAVDCVAECCLEVAS